MRYAVRYSRFSRGEQILGDSLKRQDREFTEFCNRHSLRPLPDYELPIDAGVSAYKGNNKTKGSLAEFLLLAKLGRIPAGTVLVVENQDRLSRDQANSVLRLFNELVDAGIAIGDCLTDKIVAAEELNDPMTLLAIVLGAQRAYEYSLSLGKRIKSAWTAKRAKVGTEKMSRMCPHWLRLSMDRQTYLPIPEKVAVVKLIFDLACKGKGCKGIVDALEERAIKSPKGNARWNPTFIVRLLKDRSVLGEFQPEERVGRHKSVAVGKPVEGYFPAIISKRDFDKANALVTSRNLRRQGRPPSRINLFAGLLYDEHGSPYHIMIIYPRQYRLLESKYGRGGSRISYEMLVKAFVQAVREIDPSDFQVEPDDTSTKLVEELASLDGKLAGIKLRIKKEQDIEYLLDLLRELTAAREATKSLLDQVEMSRRNPVREAVVGLQKTTVDDPEFYRAKLRLAVERITLMVRNVDKDKQAFVAVRFRRGFIRIFMFRYRNTRGYLQAPLEVGTSVFPTEKTQEWLDILRQRLSS